jgi:hypothetical protein
LGGEEEIMAIYEEICRRVQQRREFAEGTEEVAADWKHAGLRAVLIRYGNGRLSAWVVKKNGNPLNNGDRIPVNLDYGGKDVEAAKSMVNRMLVGIARKMRAKKG